MDTSVEVVAMDTLGRRNGPRRMYTLAEKRVLVKETQRRGASVAEAAQRHGVNAICCSVGGGCTGKVY